jgi:biopolymer transport protein ExbB
MTTNAYGLMNLWQQGDWITRTVAVFLLAMSVTSWTVILLKSKQLNAVKAQAKTSDQLLARDRAWSVPASETSNSGVNVNPFQTLIQEGLKAASYHLLHRGKLAGSVNQSEWVSLSLRRVIENTSQTLQADLPILASIGSTAPFVGLFGTVWGIYHALVNIGTSGQSSIDQIAGPVGEALIMTAFGLAVAIPAVLGYNFLLQGQKKLLARLRDFAHDVQVRLLVENGQPDFEDFQHDDSLSEINRKQGVGV